MALSEDAVIKLRLDTAQARAELAKFSGDAKGITLGTGGGGPGVPGRPGGGGSGGGGILSQIMGNPFMSALGAGVGMLTAPGIGDAVGGANGYLGQYGHNLAEGLGLGRWNRDSKVRGNAEDATVDIIGMGGGNLGKDKIMGIYEMEKAIYKMKADSESRVRETIGVAEAADPIERLIAKMDSLVTKIDAKETAPVPATKGPR